MDINATYSRIGNPNYLKALNVQNALGYWQASWHTYELACGRKLNGAEARYYGGREVSYIGQQIMHACLDCVA